MHQCCSWHGTQQLIDIGHNIVVINFGGITKQEDVYGNYQKDYYGVDAGIVALLDERI